MDEELAAAIGQLTRTLKGSSDDQDSNLLEEIRDKLISIDKTLNTILDRIVDASPKKD